MILVVVAENGKRFRIECNKNTVLKFNGRKCTFLRKSCRRVYRCGKYVIKIDGGSDPVVSHQNIKEYEKWLEIKPEDRKHFAKVIGYKSSGRGWSVLIQEYVSGRKSDDYREIDPI